YEAKKSDYDWNMEKVKRQYGLLLVLIVAIYFICTILFENFHQAFVVILIIPVSFIGLFLTFVLFDLSFDQGGYAAFIMLGGLVVNAALFIINDYNAYAKPSLKNLIKAMGGKAIPILLTVFSTCFGLLPFLVGGQEEVFWFSLAAGTIGGLIFSLFAVFFVLPVKLKFKTK
ncbi:MAG: efflux RND transporter permease subunit, partial [Cyclobacteriaceae bacterium]|nr:efflux RND transporter permease subunit [Cyclobacteriaceae bacterium]